MNEFAKYYYNTFDSDRTRLAPLYRENSMMTFETNQHQGVSPIIEKLTSLPFGKVAHRITTLDAQPAGPNGNIMVQVTGELVIDDSEHPQRYSQCFHLVPEGESYYVLNDIFRLVYC
ncbi:nuclear transport factor 2 [Morchella conica CCBAS932]|uniref:Nuclear transport factor 2 n=1 Tax=Morchella conica CCBAS932 TaxID=1392247 RepID=A0A3N4KM86_9PEZI|nr:nuclear transport factor 2 [Morchella conica CCBAS932]